MVHILETNPNTNLEKHSCPNDIKCLFIELSFRKSKWMLCGKYHPPSQNDKYHFNYFYKAVDATCSNYERVLFVLHYIEAFLYKRELSKLVKEKTCSKICKIQVV